MPGGFADLVQQAPGRRAERALLEEAWRPGQAAWRVQVPQLYVGDPQVWAPGLFWPGRGRGADVMPLGTISGHPTALKH